VRLHDGKKNDEEPRPVKSWDQGGDWESEYENLRRDALDHGSRHGHGLALFVSRGMTAWLEALTALRPRPLRPSAPAESVDSSPVLRPDLTTLLANMVLSCLGREESREQFR